MRHFPLIALVLLSGCDDEPTVTAPRNPAAAMTLEERARHARTSGIAKDHGKLQSIARAEAINYLMALQGKLRDQKSADEQATALSSTRTVGAAELAAMNMRETRERLENADQKLSERFRSLRRAEADAGIVGQYSDQILKYEEVVERAVRAYSLERRRGRGVGKVSEAHATWLSLVFMTLDQVEAGNFD